MLSEDRFDSLAKNKLWRLSPPSLLALSFVVLIAIGTVLLKAPISHYGDISWLDALFTACSGVSITGLSTIDVGSHLTVFGQVVLLVLMQLGGIGIMTFAALTFLLLGGRMGMGYQQLVSDAMNQTQPRDLFWLLRRIGIFVFATEAVGMLLFALYWIPQYGWIDGVYISFFHAISAFNNVGFTLWPDSLMGSQSSVIVIMVTSAMIVAGGLGFTVVNDCWKQRQWHALTLHSKLTLIGTAGLLLAGFVLFTLIEWNNTGTLGALSTGDKLLNGWFLSVAPRTSGFNTVDITQFANASIVIMVAFMFIGAGTNSTGGGIKVSTMMVLLLATKSFLTGKQRPVIFERTISYEAVYKALAVSFISLLMVVLGLFLITLTDPQFSLTTLLVEVVSALSTTGHSFGVTSQLSPGGQLILIVLMFLGRLGPLTMAFVLTKAKSAPIDYVEGEVHIG